jgi:6-phosphogluconolactonase
VGYARGMARRALLSVLVLALGCSSEPEVEPDAGAAPSPTTTSPGPSPEGGAVDSAAPLPDGAVPDAAVPEGPRTEVAFVGGGDGMVRTYALDATTGALSPLSSVSAGNDPSYLAFDEARQLAFAIDSGQNQVRTFAVSPKTGTLTAKGQAVGTGGTGATHVSLVPSGKYLLVAHYTSGHLAVVPVAADGTLSAPSDVVLAGDKAHFAEMDAAKRTVFVPCLGANVVARYTLDETTGKLTALAPVALPAGAGPRHLSFASGSPFVFVVNELASSVTSFSYDAATGGLGLVETKSSLPAGFAGANTGAAIFAHPSGKVVYASNRGEDSIARFTYDAQGRLTREGSVPTSGRIPRSFGLAGKGRFAYVANQGSGTVYGYTIDPATFAMSPMGASAQITGLTSPKFVGTARFVDK